VKILILSAYAAVSHQRWAAQLQQMFADCELTLLELPPRHFSWRVRGNPLYWSLEHRDTLQQGHDLLIATSMVDLATLRGLVPSLASIPTLLYFHENQFEYPAGRSTYSLLEAQMVSLYSALAADHILFNSRFNQQTFLAGCDALLNRLPDKVPAGVVSLLASRSEVLPVPFESPAAMEPERSLWSGQGDYPQRPLRLLWNARFEYDKGPDRLLAVLQGLEARGLDYQLALAGQRFRQSPPEFDLIEQQFKHRLVHTGFLEQRCDLAALQAGADIILSTALHEFQGLAVLEAVACGALPVVPDRLSYRELYPDAYRYASFEGDPQREAKAAAELVSTLAASLAQGEIAAPDIGHLATISMTGPYRQLCFTLAGHNDPVEAFGE
jgi:glycosyltransferase involved in cell wall biosynthesis